MIRKSHKRLIIIVVLVLPLILIIFTLNAHKEFKPENDDKIEISESKPLKYFDTKYSLNDMYNLISKNEIPYDDDEFFDIILNWFDYYGEDNLFINHFGDNYSIDEYKKIKDEFSEGTLKTLLVDAKKSWFFPILSK